MKEVFIKFSYHPKKPFLVQITWNRRVKNYETFVTKKAGMDWAELNAPKCPQYDQTVEGTVVPPAVITPEKTKPGRLIKKT